MLEIRQFDTESVWYSPDYKDNRSKLECEQFSVLIAPMTSQDLRRSEEQHGGFTRGKINFTKRYNKIREQILTQCIHEIKNCFYVLVKNGQEERREIKASQELCEKAGEEILEDIYAAIKDQSVLAEGLLGKQN